MSTQKEIFQENMNGLFETINAKVGTNGAMTIAEMKTAVANVVLPSKYKVPFPFGYVSSYEKGNSRTAIYKIVLSDTVPNNSSYYVLGKFTFSNSNWESLTSLEENTPTYFGRMSVNYADGSTSTYMQQYNYLVYAIKIENVVYFAINSDTFYLPVHGVDCAFLAPILTKNTPSRSLGTISSTTSVQASGKPTVVSRVSSASSTIYLLNDKSYATSIYGFYFTMTVSTSSTNINFYSSTSSIVETF